MCIGQDRYKRRYHILPHAGGVFVEGLESGELLEDGQCVRDNVKEEKEKKRKRSSSGHSISDSNSTPTNEQNTKLTIDTQMSESQTDISDVKSPKLKNAAQFPGIVSPINKRPNSLIDDEIQKPLCNEAGVVSPKQEVLSPKAHIMSPRGSVVSSPGLQHGALLKTPTDVKESPMTWFHLFPKKACDETSLTRASIIPPAAKRGRMIIPPNVMLLSQDRNFCESISDRHHMYMHGSLDGPHGHHHYHHHDRSGYYEHTAHHGSSGYHGAFTPNGASHQVFHYPGMLANANNPNQIFQYEDMTKAEKLGLAPPGVDIQKLIKQDPQEAAVLLDIQSLEPAPVPEGKQTYICYVLSKHIMPML